MFTATEGHIYRNFDYNAVFLRKQAEIHVHERDTDPQTGLRAKNWQGLNHGIRIPQGAAARKLRRNNPNRDLRSRYLEKWKDMGDEYDNGLGDLNGESARTFTTLMLNCSIGQSRRPKRRTYHSRFKSWPLFERRLA